MKNQPLLVRNAQLHTPLPYMNVFYGQPLEQVGKNAFINYNTGLVNLIAFLARSALN